MDGIRFNSSQTIIEQFFIQEDYSKQHIETSKNNFFYIYYLNSYYTNSKLKNKVMKNLINEIDYKLTKDD